MSSGRRLSRSRKLIDGTGSARRGSGDGALGVVVAPQGRLLLVLNLTFAGDRIAAIDVVADPDRLGALDLSTLP